VLLESYLGTMYPTFFPDFYATLEGCQNCIESWGQSAHISILVMDKNPIGICATNLNGTNLYVSNLSLIPAYHGKGLGKTLLVLSLLEASKEGGEVQSASLDTNPSDKAYNLYKSLGFVTEDYRSYFVWTKG
jgi:ribosomal protein S18 acetylase RimI-like enzyme